MDDDAAQELWSATRERKREKRRARKEGENWERIDDSEKRSLVGCIAIYTWEEIRV